jgi:hypothetical protein
MSDHTFQTTMQRFPESDASIHAGEFTGAVMTGMTGTTRKVPVNVDLVFAVDRTGSSQGFATGIVRAISMVAEPVVKRAARVRLFLQTHGDLDDGQRPIMVLRDGNLDEVIEAARRIDFGGGGDAPEHHTHALEEVLDTVDWTAAGPTRRAVVLFTTADTKPSPSGRNAGQIADALRANDVLLFAVCEKEPGMLELVNRAQGEAFAISNDPSQAEMQSIAARVAASVLASLVQHDARAFA